MFNVAHLIKFKRASATIDLGNAEVSKDVTTAVQPPRVELEVEKVLDSKVKKTTRHKVYMEHLIKWRHRL